MGVIDQDVIQDNAARAETLLSLLANRHRLMILCHLAEGDKSVSQLLALLPLSQSALSQHLAKLRQEKLVASEPDGQNRLYSLCSPEARKIIEVLCRLYL